MLRCYSKVLFGAALQCLCTPVVCSLLSHLLSRCCHFPLQTQHCQNHHSVLPPFPTPPSLPLTPPSHCFLPSAHIQFTQAMGIHRSWFPHEHSLPWPRQHWGWLAGWGCCTVQGEKVWCHIAIGYGTSIALIGTIYWYLQYTFDLPILPTQISISIWLNIEIIEWILQLSSVCISGLCAVLICGWFYWMCEPVLFSYCTSLVAVQPTTQYINISAVWSSH